MTFNSHDINICLIKRFLYCIGHVRKEVKFIVRQLVYLSCYIRIFLKALTCHVYISITTNLQSAEKEYFMLDDFIDTLGVQNGG